MTLVGRSTERGRWDYRSDEDEETAAHKTPRTQKRQKRTKDPKSGVLKLKSSSSLIKFFSISSSSTCLANRQITRTTKFGMDRFRALLDEAGNQPALVQESLDVGINLVLKDSSPTYIAIVGVFGCKQDVVTPIAECDVLSVSLADSNSKSLKSLIKMLGNSRSSINFASCPKCDYQSLKRVAGQHKCDNDTAPQFYLSHSQVARTFRELPIRLQLRLSVGHRNPSRPDSPHGSCIALLFESPCGNHFLGV